MALSAAQIAALNAVESEMARKGFALGTMLDAAIGADIVTAQAAADAAQADATQALSDASAAQADADAVQGGLLEPASGNTETSAANGGAIAVDTLETLITSAGVETRTLAAPGVKGQLKVITMTVDMGDVTLAGTNILGQEALTGTFDDVGDTLVLYGYSTTKWVILGGNVAFA